MNYWKLYFTKYFLKDVRFIIILLVLGWCIKSCGGKRICECCSDNEMVEIGKVMGTSGAEACETCCTLKDVQKQLKKERRKY